MKKTKDIVRLVDGIETINGYSYNHQGMNIFIHRPLYTNGLLNKGWVASYDGYRIAYHEGTRKDVINKLPSKEEINNALQRL